ncbi:staygreen family protein [Candidatus Bathyarchaeota archaeon]|nr:staygreen family protein [Candidatus Bathyarchaeota archaeon]
MSRLDPKKLHVRFDGVARDVFALPRRYTLTHSDRTGDLYLTIGLTFDNEQISEWYTRFMRDEVLAEWKLEQNNLCLHGYCHVCGGFVFGNASLREWIFRREMRRVLQAIRHGDRELFAENPRLDQTEILVHFHKSKAEECKIEQMGCFGNYDLQQ